jgi:CubicO group peptidase (beta-lactamase class C family)
MQKILLFLLILNGNKIMGQTIDAKLTELTEKFDLSGIAMCTFEINAYNQMKIISKGAAGYSNIFAKTFLTDTTRVRIASISKLITTIGILQLVDQHKIYLDDDISKYLDYKVYNPSFDSKNITIRMLLNHTSSLEDGSNYNRFLSATYDDTIIPNLSSILTKEGFFYDSTMFSHHEPGTYFSYANINFGIIGTLIEKISGQRFDLYMKDHILKQLKIDGSYFVPTINNYKELAMPYRFENSLWTAQTDDYMKKEPSLGNALNYTVGTNAVRFGPHGGLRVSMYELSKLIAMLANKGIYNNIRILSKTSCNLMTNISWSYNGKNGNTNNNFFQTWGLGTQIINTKPFNKSMYRFFADDWMWYGHAGEAYGLVSNAYYNPLLKKGFAFFISGSKNGYLSDTTNIFSTIEHKVFDIIADELKIKKNILKKNSVIVEYKDGLIKLKNLSLSPVEFNIQNSNNSILFKKMVAENEFVEGFYNLPIDDTYYFEVKSIKTNLVINRGKIQL